MNRQTRHRRHHQHSRRHTRRGGGMFNFFAKNLTSDNYLVTLDVAGAPVKCSICNSAKFQKRNATFDKSKSSQMVWGDTAESVNDVSVTAFFCHNCGVAIIARDPKVAVEGNYSNLIKFTDVAAPPKK